MTALKPGAAAFGGGPKGHHRQGFKGEKNASTRTMDQ
jgi:hypothetical protein